MTHLLPIQRMTIRQPGLNEKIKHFSSRHFNSIYFADLMGRGAEKFISLTPICCTESRAFVSTDPKEKLVV